LERSAESIYQEIAAKAILDLQQITDLGLGDGTGLTNVWEEICVQRQGDESEVWEVYEETVRACLAGHAALLSEAERRLLWLETDQGFEWQCGDDSEQELEPPISNEGIIEYAAKCCVYLRADEFSNDRITAFLTRSNFQQPTS
jgi:hypothetical protein